MNIKSAWNEQTERYEIDSVDVPGGLGGAEQWHSHDGYAWFDNHGDRVSNSNEVFRDAEITFIDGPQKGETFA